MTTSSLSEIVAISVLPPGTSQRQLWTWSRKSRVDCWNVRTPTLKAWNLESCLQISLLACSLLFTPAFSSPIISPLDIAGNVYPRRFASQIKRFNSVRDFAWTEADQACVLQSCPSVIECAWSANIWGSQPPKAFARGVMKVADARNVACGRPWTLESAVIRAILNATRLKSMNQPRLLEALRRFIQNLHHFRYFQIPCCESSTQISREGWNLVFYKNPQKREQRRSSVAPREDQVCLTRHLQPYNLEL